MNYGRLVIADNYSSSDIKCILYNARGKGITTEFLSSKEYHLLHAPQVPEETAPMPVTWKMLTN